MERDEAHLAHINAALYLGYESIVYLSVSHMSPPDENVGIVKHLVGKALIGIVEGGEGDLIAGLGEELTDASVNAVGIYGLDGLLGLFVAELVPNRDADLSFHSEFPF
jgi:hypothetical protein